MKKERESLNIMIVDDEEMSRNFFLTCIDWSQYDIQVTYEASSGLEAITLLEDAQPVPDIIFTDIRMPYMDGLELSQIILKKYPNIKIVVLTAHKDFEYAQKSIHIGITNFLLKPVSANDLLEILQKLKAQIIEEREQWNELDHLKTIIRDNYIYLRERFLLNLMESPEQNIPDRHQLSYYYAAGIPDYVQVTLLGTASRGFGSMSEEEHILNDLRILEYIKTHIKDMDHIEFLTDHNHHIAIISYSESVNITEMCEQIQYSINHISGLQISFGIGSAYHNFLSISDSYREALEALRFAHFMPSQPITVYQNDINIQDDMPAYRPEISEDIKLYIKAGLTDEVTRTLPTLFQNASGEYIPVDHARVLSITLLSAAVTIANEIGLPFSDFFEQNAASFLSVLSGSNTAAIQKETHAYIQKLTGNIANHRANKRNNTLWEILQYIQKEISNPALSLNLVADAFHMNDSYLSRTFKKELGFSFSKYVTRLRMDHAISLLMSTDLKAYQIAEAVGIPDAYYFSNCFKKYTGKSVRDYKKGLSQNS